MKYLFLFLVLLPTFTFADDSPLIPTATLVDRAVEMTGYTKPEGLPQVVELTQQQMADKICNGNPKCGVFGFYQDKDIIYIRGDVIPNAHDHLLFHEIVHWLQHHSGKFDLNKCEDTIQRELEAYRAENQYMSEYQGGFQFILPPRMDCHMIG